MKLQVEANQIFEPLWKTKKRYILLMGGRSGGRSYEASQKIVSLCYQNARYFRGAIMRAIHADIRSSVWQEITDRVNGWDLSGAFDVKESTMELTRGRNSVKAHGFRKSSSERTAKLKSLANYTDAFIEEAEEIGEEEFTQLDDSLRAEGSQIHLLFNTPSKAHWIIKRWFDLIPSYEAKGFYEMKLKPEYEKDVEVLFSTHLDNIYIPQEVHDRYEAYKLSKPDYYWQMIRGLCPETLMGRIYSGWKAIGEIPHEARLLGYGLDFGYDPDPAALVAVYYHNGGYILDEKLYERNLINEQLSINIKLYPQALVVADSAEPKSIEELKRYGINVVPCEKGADSVLYGIKHVQGLKISYTSNSHNLKAEYENYAFKVDKDGTNLGIEDPKSENHLMSATRYFLSTMIKANADPEAQERERELARAKARQTANKLTQTTR
ncbi:phage terminase large subunit [Methanoculleus sp.]|jgi:phage terminase large subunit|uniref:PBSX family phage terminase large subunit n=1 Tax=Methanoculleus sp. TaxID=90427 RepID=UPI0025F46E85|nr:phage terminase large subunit [Methanoculleus sp.]MCK9319535.1 phage terminase large subunit [Methanoculleus sp.]